MIWKGREEKRRDDKGRVGKRGQEERWRGREEKWRDDKGG